jgi:hypothetical protein
MSKKAHQPQAPDCDVTYTTVTRNRSASAHKLQSALTAPTVTITGWLPVTVTTPHTLYKWETSHSVAPQVRSTLKDYKSLSDLFSSDFLLFTVTVIIVCSFVAEIPEWVICFMSNYFPPWFLKVKKLKKLKIVAWIHNVLQYRLLILILLWNEICNAVEEWGP